MAGSAFLGEHHQMNHDAEREIEQICMDYGGADRYNRAMLRRAMAFAYADAAKVAREGDWTDKPWETAEAIEARSK